MKFVIKQSNMLPHQKTWWNLRNFIKLLVGGYGCGKSYIACLRAIYLSYVNSGIHGMIVSPSYKMAKKTIIPTFSDIFRRSGLRVTFNKTDNEYLIHNWNGRIWIGSGDDPDSLRGPNLAWAGIDEPFIQKKEVLDQMMARIRHIEASQRELFLTGTPEQLNWGYDIATNDQGQYNVGIVYGKTKDNPNIDADFFQRLWNSYTPEMRDAYLEGKFINLTQGRVYKPFDRTKHIKHIETKGLEIRAGLDFNVDYMTAEVFALGNGWIHFIDEIRLTYNSDSFVLAEKLKEKYYGIKVYPDATGAQRRSSSTKSDHQIFRDAGFQVIARKANPAVRDRVNSVNKMLMNDRLTIEPGTCKNLISDLERNVWKSNDIDKQSELSMTHAGDAAGYPIYYIFPIKKTQAIGVKQ